MVCFGECLVAKYGVISGTSDGSRTDCKCCTVQDLHTCPNLKVGKTSSRWTKPLWEMKMLEMRGFKLFLHWDVWLLCIELWYRKWLYLKQKLCWEKYGGGYGFSKLIVLIIGYYANLNIFYKIRYILTKQLIYVQILHFTINWRLFQLVVAALVVVVQFTSSPTGIMLVTFGHQVAPCWGWQWKGVGEEGVEVCDEDWRKEACRVYDWKFATREE